MTADSWTSKSPTTSRPSTPSTARCLTACTVSSSRPAHRRRSRSPTTCRPTGLPNRRINVGAWKHGISIYGWKTSGDGGLTDRPPQLRTGAGTIRLRTDHADAITDDELRALAHQALGC